MQTADGVEGSFGPLGWCAAVEITSQFRHSLLYAGLGIADACNKMAMPGHHGSAPPGTGCRGRSCSRRSALLPAQFWSSPMGELGNPSPEGQVTSPALGRHQNCDIQTCCSLGGLPGSGQPLARLRATSCGWEGVVHPPAVLKDAEDLLSIWYLHLAAVQCRSERRSRLLGVCELCS